MGTITRALANNITTGGVVASSGVSNTSVSAITSLSGVSELNDTFQLISTQTASASSSISFTSGLDSTYDVYCFKFYNIHPATNDTNLNYNGSTDGGSNYNVTKTTSFFEARHKEDGSSTSLAYNTGADLAQSTGYQRIINGLGNADDSSGSGELWLFDPSNTTYVKHFMSRLNSMNYQSPPFTQDIFVAGYFNTTSAINAIDFQMSSGNIDAGTIKLFGIRDVEVGGI